METKKSRGRPHEPEFESVRPSFVPDIAHCDDSLGFGPYVRALTRFLQSPETRPPLTISIEGEWGSGKTSFMHQLRESTTMAGFQTVWYDAWRNEKQNDVWAGFALECIRQLRANLPLHQRLWLSLVLVWRRHQWDADWGVTVKFILTLSLLALALVGMVGGYLAYPTVIDAITPYLTLDPGRHPWLKLAVQWASLGALLAFGLQIWTGLWRNLFGLFQRLITLDISRLRQDPEYKEYLGLAHRFSTDFGRILDTYRQARPTCVFVDDLDRCPPARAVELLEAINVIVAAAPRVFFILALDRDKLAAAFAMKYQGVLPYLGGAAGSDNKRDVQSAGLALGHGYIEKFVQVPFRLPRASAVELGALLDTPFEVPRTHYQASPWERLRALLTRVKPFATAHFPLPLVLTPWDREDGTNFYLELGNDSPRIRELVQLVAPALAHNPRRIKQFINLLRLRAALAAESNLLRPEKVEQDGRGLTLTQLAKWMAISLRWPELARAMETNRGLLEELQLVALGQMEESDTEWAHEAVLLSLLAEGCRDQSGQIRTELVGSKGLGRVDVGLLMQISPPVNAVFSEESMSKAKLSFPIKQPRMLGVTSSGVEFWNANRHRLGRISEVLMLSHMKETAWPLRIRDESGTELWITGCSGGYGGTGPDGTVTILTDLGLGPADTIRRFVRSHESFLLVGIRPDLFQGEMEFSYTPRKGTAGPAEGQP